MTERVFAATEFAAVSDTSEGADKFDVLADETRAQVLARVRREGIARKERAALSGDQCAAVYRRLIMRSRQLSDGECRLLCTLTTCFGERLENCWPGLKAIQKKLGGEERSISQISRLRTKCERKGFLRRVSLTISEDEELIEIETGGRFISEVGNQFLLPEGFLGLGESAWEGPRVWSKRVFTKARRW